MTRRPHTADEYVDAYLTRMRCRPKERTVFTLAGRRTVRSNGERRIVAPNGQPIRVIGTPDGGTQVEVGDRLHAVVRPRPIILDLNHQPIRRRRRRLILPGAAS